MTVKLTQETILATRQSYVDGEQACIDEVLSGLVILPSHTSKTDYFAYCRSRAIAALAGEFDHTLTFLQRAHYIQTGECIALLP